MADGPGLVDHQAHWYPRAGFELLLDRPRYPTASRVEGGYRYEHSPDFSTVLTGEFLEVELQLEDMDLHGVDAMVGNPALCLGDVAGYGELAVEMCELLNAEMGRAQHEHAQRFYGVASLPWHEPETALDVLERAVSEHDLRGVCLHSNIAGTAIGTDDLLVLFRRIEALGLPVVLHPTAATAMSSAYARYGDTIEMINWLFDTSAAALSLIYGGVLDACPQLVVLHPHLGGTLPFLAGRIRAFDRLPDRETTHPVDEYFKKRFYVDTVTTTPRALTMAEQLYDPGRVVFGTDYPFVPRRVSLGFLRGELSEAAMTELTGHTMDWSSRRT
ncbi:MAG: aminocarboxymuconate-semialdehyde decarboxylase [Solirubrobacteraceae bacterium]